LRTESISRRLAALEAKVTPKMHPLKAQLIQHPTFARLVADLGLNFEEIKKLPGPFDGLPRDTVRLIADRLKALNAADRTAYEEKVCF
jgi:hypothetical protein